MKSKDLLIIVAVALGIFVIGRRVMANPVPASNGKTTLIMSYDGWDYFSDGTAIDYNTSPTGSYYYKGQLVSSPSGTWT